MIWYRHPHGPMDGAWMVFMMVALPTMNIKTTTNILHDCIGGYTTPPISLPTTNPWMCGLFRSNFLWDFSPGHLWGTPQTNPSQDPPEDHPPIGHSGKL